MTLHLELCVASRRNKQASKRAEVFFCCSCFSLGCSSRMSCAEFSEASSIMGQEFQFYCCRRSPFSRRRTKGEILRKVVESTRDGYTDLSVKEKTHSCARDDCCRGTGLPGAPPRSELHAIIFDSISKYLRLSLIYELTTLARNRQHASVQLFKRDIQDRLSYSAKDLAR